jgi:plasmid stabilization system protein ParE
MAEIRWTSEAETWLQDIHDYIFQDNPSAATRVIQGIYEKAQMLGRFPDMGLQYRSEKEGEVRILLYGHYRIAYLRHTMEDVVDILGVFHGALDMDRYL